MPDPSLVEDMLNFPLPDGSRKVKSFLAMLNFYREHLENFGPKSEPLAKLAREDFVWTQDTWEKNPDARECFEQLKRDMCDAPMLALPDFDADFFIQSDASKFGAGAVLYQYDKRTGKKQVVSYASWLFNSAQRKYDTTERELLALVLATRKWKPYLRRCKFVAETDHKPLEGFMSLDDPFGKIARWIAELAQFDFTVKYIKGVTNIPADTLSRCREETYVGLESMWCVTDSEANRWAGWRPSKALARSFDEGSVLSACLLEDEVETILANILDFGLPSDSEWVEEIRKDSDFGPLYDYITLGKLPDPLLVAGSLSDARALEVLRTVHMYAVNPDSKLLYYRSKVTQPERLVLCVPKPYRRFVLQECHDSIWAGAHMGRDKTLDKVRSKYYFKFLEQYVDLWVKTCNACQACKRKHPSADVALGSIEASRRFEMLSIDLWDAGVISTHGKRYVLTVIDVFSKYAWAIPIRDKRAVTVARKLVKYVFSIFVPMRLHSDQGSEFINSVLDQITELYGVDKSRTTAYHPQGNAVAERIHQFLRNGITAFIRRDQRNWDDVVQILMSAYNSSVHEALDGNSPSQVMFGIDNFLPVVTEKEEALRPSLFVDRLKLALMRVQNHVMRHRSEKLAKRSSYPQAIFREGDKVGLSVEYLPAGFTSLKLFPRWKGPYVVTRTARDGKVVYLRDPFGMDVANPVSAMRLKRWMVREDFLDDCGELLIRSSKNSGSGESTEAPRELRTNIDVPGELPVEGDVVKESVFDEPHVHEDVVKIMPSSEPPREDVAKMKLPDEPPQGDVIMGKQKLSKKKLRVLRELDFVSPGQKNLPAAEVVGRSARPRKPVSYGAEQILFVMLSDDEPFPGQG